jgi:UTP--glucose-1-phosphate uridylyltransferase
LLPRFDSRFAAGAPSLADATSLQVEGDWTFGADVRVTGDVTLDSAGGTVPDGEQLTS